MGHRHEIPEGTKGAVITVSDTRSLEDDHSGEHIVQVLEDKGVKVVSRKIIKDEAEDIRSEVQANLEEADIIIITGGTGVSTRDVTIEALEFDMELPGFGELFRYLSYKEIGSHALMSRATLGTKQGIPIFCLPGSQNAVKLAMKELVLPEIGHVLAELRR
jgi:molybdenum cofactor biosynthesis protein B